jgi:ABC-2 type transport system ATP-binding protein
VDGVSYAYGKSLALDGVSFAIGPGSFAALLGPNGAGKTTLFSLITRLIGMRQGRIAICGRDIRETGAKALAPLGVVFQQPTLDLDLTVRQNLRYFARLRGMSSREADVRIARELDRLEMGDRLREKVRDLNGGHRRRVEIARALIHEPQLLLLDEATVGLDVPTRKGIVEHVHALAEDRGLAVLWATHLIDEIRPHDQLIVLHRGRVAGQGRAADVIAGAGAKDLDGAFAALTRREAAAA